MQIKNLKNKVEFCLKEYPETRNSDITLTTMIWEIYYPEFLIKREKDGLMYIALNSLYLVPREDNIKRIRAKFQNEDSLYLPTDPKIVEQRKINMDVWRKAMGYNY